jgi:tetratricopeptide (TPR) repeat protein
MLNGLKFNRHISLIALIAILLVIFLGSRPKFVVKGENQSVQSNQSTAEKSSEDHKVELKQEIKQQISSLKLELASVSDNSKKAIIFSKVASLFASESVFDSAGYYSQKLAEIQPNTLSWIMVGDYYYQAYSLALDPIKIEQFMQRTRDAYTKVLELEPSNLHAKTNLAMTFVRSDAPMKAISMLREVLDQEPNYVPALMSLGGLSMQSNQYDKALARFQYVLKIDPKNVNAKIGMAYSLIELNNVEKAKVIFKEVLKEDIDNSLKDEITKTLNNLK